MSERDVVVVGHRGAAGLHPENTLLGFEEALRLGVDALECDVRLTADGVPVLIHDATLDRTTDGTGPVAERSFTQVRRLDAGQGQRVPTLDQFLERMAGRAELLVEIKAGEALDAVLKALDDGDLWTEVTVTGFDHDLLARAHRREPRLRTGAIFGTVPEDPAAAPAEAQAIGAAGIGLRHDAITPAHVEAARDAGLELRAWTIDEEDGMRRALELGVDGITTNRPDRLLRLLGRL